jgi:short-subunit dehydrogenase/acyl carrier protein
MGTVLLPGTAFVELALTAAQHIGATQLDELTLQTPLTLDEHEIVHVQVRVGAADGSGRRAIGISSRSAGDDEAGDWTRHASGAVAPGTEAEPSESVRRLAAESWPPANAEQLDVDGLYDRLMQLGLTYGPAFRGIRAAWRRGGELFADVALDGEHAEEAGRYDVHPALFDAALQAGVDLMGDGGDGAAMMLFRWEGVRCLARHARSMRVRLSLPGDEAWNVDVAAVDERGAAILSVGRVVARPVEAEQLASARRRRADARYVLRWDEVAVPSSRDDGPHAVLLGDLGAGDLGERYADLGALVDAVEGGADPPDVVLAAVPATDGGDMAEAARAGARRTLELLQAWLAQERLAKARLVLVTRAGVAVHDGQAPDPAVAAQWGVVRSAQSEHPGRFWLLDNDGAPASWRAAAALLATREPQLAVRDGVALAPRVAPAPSGGAAGSPAFGPDGTVLITGGTGGLGALLARHLVAKHGVRHLLLASRSGSEAPGASELEDELVRLGASPRLVACDVGERDELSGLIASIAPEHPLTSVIHAAGVLDDGMVESLTPEQVERVMRPKADGALHLHECTQGHELAHFVIFSSFAATLGSPGQANYAAANAFADALTQLRRASGLAAQSLVWGPWSDAGGMTRDRSAADDARIRRLGAAWLSDDEGLALFDAAVEGGEPVPLLVRIDAAELRVTVRDGALPPILSGLVRSEPEPGRADEATGLLQRRLSDVSESARPEVVLEIVLDQVASVLALESREAVEPQLAFGEMGFDSLSAVELRNGLMRATGLALPATLVFDHPTPSAVAEYVLGQLPRDEVAQPQLELEFERIERLLREMTTDAQARPQVEERVRAFNTRVRGLLAAAGRDPRQDDEAADLAAASDEEMFALIDDEVGAA